MSEHTEHEHGCCGGDHEHKHEHGCCGGDHEHDHEHGCCGGDHEHDQEAIEISDIEHQFLMALAEVSFLPVARFVMGSTKSEHLSSVALAPVFIQESEVPMDEVKMLGEGLLHLEEFGLITLDYDQPLDGYDYHVYEQSDVYKEFQKVVLEGSTREDFLFDSGAMEKGSIALTTLGQGAIDQLQTID